MYLISICIVIIGSVFYTTFQNIVPDTVNPLIALCCMYSAGMTMASIFYFKTRKQYRKKGIKEKFDWRIIAFGLTNIVIDTGFLLAFRSGWEVGVFNVSSNIAILIILTITGALFFREKITPINIMGIIVGIIGLSILKL